MPRALRPACSTCGGTGRVPKWPSNGCNGAATEQCSTCSGTGFAPHHAQQRMKYYLSEVVSAYKELLEAEATALEARAKVKRLTAANL